MTVTMLPATSAQAAAASAKTAAAEKIELVQNGDFEQDSLEGWKGFENGKIEIVSMDDGHALRVKERTGSQSSAACILSGKLAKGKSYKVSGKIKYDGTEASMTYRMVFQNGPS